MNNKFVFVLDHLDSNHGTFLNFYNEDECVVLERKLISDGSKEGDIVIFTDHSFTKYSISKEKTIQQKNDIDDLLRKLSSKKDR